MNLTRKILAATLTLLAVLVAAWPSQPEAELVVAAHDLAPGVPLTAEDLKTIKVPPELSPAGTVTHTEATGRTLTSAARSGEPLTNARLTEADPETATVAVPLATPMTNPAMPALLRPGSRVDVIGPESRVLAENASVVTLQADKLAILTMHHKAATRVASESLSHPLAITLR
ncbi:SAF domain-containing protein [Actinosynnema sp. CS-041913]|uniref:SAF domain-containing protein n=1 Tax=Actinosynnema sp. CS-041913 TaxID=3239917 RepID=UPI003D927D75